MIFDILICISYIASKFEHLFIHLKAIHSSSSMNGSYSFCNFGSHFIYSLQKLKPMYT